MKKHSERIAVIFAGGMGIRMGAALPKQFIEICGMPVLAHTLKIFQRHDAIDGIYLVSNPKFIERTNEIVNIYKFDKVRKVVSGGAQAQESIYNGLVAVAKDCPPETIVLLHDGVRPYLDDDVIDRNIDGVMKFGNAVTFTPCVETLVISKNGNSISEIPFRRESYAAQAPQSFRLGDILKAHDKIRARPNGYEDMIDQATICWTLGIPINLVPGNRGNIKITTVEDVYTLEALLKYREDFANGRTLIDC